MYRNKKEMFFPIPEGLSPIESATTSIRYLLNYHTGGFKGSPKTRRNIWTHLKNLGGCVWELRQEGNHLELLDVYEDEARKIQVNHEMPKCKEPVCNSVVQMITNEDIERTLRRLKRSLNP